MNEQPLAKDFAWKLFYFAEDSTTVACCLVPQAGYYWVNAGDPPAYVKASQQDIDKLIIQEQPK